MILLKIITPHGLFWNNEVSLLNIKSSSGYITILPHHTPLLTPIDVCPMYFINSDGEKIFCACSEGMIIVKEDEILLLVEAIERQDQINLERAEADLQLAQKMKESNIDIRKAEIKLKRALNRIDVFSKK